MKCDQCDFLYINGIGRHETGCPNSGKIVTRHRFPRFYVGILNGSRDRQVFTTALEPMRYYFPEFVAIIGPFKTKRGAKWGAANPYNWSTVSEAEYMAKQAPL